MHFRSFVGFFVLFFIQIVHGSDYSTNSTIVQEEFKTPFQFEGKKIYLTLEEKIGQVLLFGFSETAMTPEFQKFLATISPGGLIVFGRNIKNPMQISTLMRQIQRVGKSRTGVAPFLAVDQEGGTVVRIRTRPPFPSALSIGNTGDPRLAFELGLQMGSLLRKIGFNMNLAPVLDLMDPEKTSFVGTRSFGFDPKKVAEMASGFSGGLIQAKVLPVAKHFPGHGQISGDSHLKLPVKNVTADELSAHDAFPFIQLHTSQLLPAVMVAHVAFPKIDSSMDPATYSRILIQNFLRDQNGYNNLVVTDDLEMLGAGTQIPIGIRAVRALNAGCDLLVVGWSRTNQISVFKALKDSIENGTLEESRLNQSVQRILNMKSSFGVSKSIQDLSVHSYKNFFSQTSYRTLIDQVIDRNMNRYLDGQGQKKTLLTSDSSIIVMSATPEFYQSFLSSFKKTKVRYFRLNNDSTTQKFIQIDTFFPNARIVFHVGGAKTAELLHLVPKSFDEKMIVVNSGEPALVDSSRKFLSVVDIGTHHPQLGSFVARKLRWVSSQNTSNEE